MDLTKRPEHEGFGDALAQAFELIVTPGIFGLGGYALDRWLGTVPLFTIVLIVLVLAYMTWKLWYEYELRMREHEDRLGVSRERR